jgi:superfamily II DNA or RNA helicase
MMLRPRQKLFVERSLRALDTHGNTLGVAPTGAGKTIMLSAAVGEHIDGGGAKAAVLAHRDELTAQNLAKFGRVNPGISTSVVDADRKSWAGQVTFAMVPTLTRQTNLAAMPALDLLVIDEAHHAVADSYRRIIDQALHRNPACRIYGVTATPNRGDKIGLRQVFSNVADQIRLGELIASGHLVPPRTFVIDVGVQDELRAVRRSGDDFDMGEVARVMDTVPVTDAVVKHWQEKASDRQTVAFCSTVAHAEHVAAAFNAAGVTTVMVTGDMPEGERRAALAAYARGAARIVVNVAVLTEGWDHPPTSCVVLLRPSSFKCTMIQMVGRGLRTVDPNEHPGIIKRDCIVLDFGTASQIHGCLEQDVDLDSQPGEGEPPTKTCPACEAEVPVAVMECPICGHTFEPRGREAAPLADFMMTEIDLLRRSAFQWCDLFGDDAALLAMPASGRCNSSSCGRRRMRARISTVGCCASSGSGTRWRTSPSPGCALPASISTPAAAVVTMAHSSASRSPVVASAATSMAFSPAAPRSPAWRSQRCGNARP